MRNLRRKHGAWRGGWGALSSLVPLVVFSLLAAAFMTQSDATLAHSFFQSPLSPPEVPASAATPTEVEPGPPEELPVLPPPEAPVVPPVESPGAPPAEEPEAAPGATAEPQLTPSTDAPEEEVVTAKPPPGEEGAAPVSEDSLAVLVDALVVGLSTLWLCCGGLALVIFFLLVVASFLLRVT